MPDRIYILTGSIGSGKTTGLKQWTAECKNVRGILTPVIDGERVFFNIGTKETFRMLAGPGEEVLAVGRFVFSREGFERAVTVIREGVHHDGWLVVDEVGPLELRGEGFATVIKEVLATSPAGLKILLVVRNGLVPQAIEYFGLEAWPCQVIEEVVGL